MSLDAVYAEGIEQGLQRWARNPGPEPEPGFSVTSFLGAGLKGVPSAALEVSGSAADVLSAFGTAAAASGGSAGGMFSLPTPEEQKQEAQARERMLKGEAFDMAAGNVLRSKAQEFAADPLTAHKADQVMHGLVRFGAKAAAAVGGMGPAGAILLGAEEGNTVTQNLRAEGVDTETAAKVGAVQGALAAGGAVMPLAGRTIPQTLGLVGVGGPGSYMAQEALSKEILQAAGYQDQASLHNPFDPLGLALSTVIPGGFGALHMRGQFRRAEAVKGGTMPLEQLKPEELRALKYDDQRLDAYAAASAERHGVPPAVLLAIKNVGEKSAPTAVSPKGAQGVMQFMPGTAKEMGLADRTDPLASIDAGARYLKKLYDAHGSWDAAVAHYNGGGAQAAIVRGGGRPTYNETAGYLDRVQKYVREQTAQESAKVPEAVDAARVTALNDVTARSLPETPDAVQQLQRAADIVGESGGRAAEVEIAPVRDIDLPQFREWFGGSKVVDAEGTPLVVYHGTDREFDNFDATKQSADGGFFFSTDPQLASRYAASRAMDDGTGANVQPVYLSVKNPLVSDDVRPEAIAAAKAAGYDGIVYRGGEQIVAFEPQQVKSAIGNSGKFDPASASLTDPLRPGEVSPRARDASNSLPPPDSVTLAEAAPVKPGSQMAAADQPGAGGAAAAQEPGAGAAPEPASPAAALDQQLAQKVAADQPDLQVVLPGTEERITVQEALARIAEEQKQDQQWADLVRVAAECALTAG